LFEKRGIGILDVRRTLRRVGMVLAIILVAIIVSSLSAWTILSPPEMQVQTQAQLSNSILQYSRNITNIVMADGSGSYKFEVGLDYNTNETAHAPFPVDVYAFLVSENKTSSFTKGVGLSLQNASVLIDGIADPTLKVRSTYSTEVASFFLTFVEVNSTGLHDFSARLILNVIDLNYIGYNIGTTDIVSLNGSIEVA
jgi:hypothetical protein